MNFNKIKAIDYMGSTQRENKHSDNGHEQTEEKKITHQPLNAENAPVDTVAISPHAAQMGSAVGVVINPRMVTVRYDSSGRPINMTLENAIAAGYRVDVNDAKIIEDDFDVDNRIAQNYGHIYQDSIKPTANLVSDLPDDVKSNLVSYNRIEQEEWLLKVLAVPGCIYSVDKIITELWWRHKIKIERTTVQARLRALTHSGYICKEAGKRGIFTINEAGKRLLGL